MSAEHTKGPWVVSDSHPKKPCLYIDNDDDRGWRPLGEVAVIYRSAVGQDAQHEADAKLIAAAPALADAAEATLLFHSAQPWDDASRQRWFALTGTFEATTKALCDFQRAALRAAGRLR